MVTLDMARDIIKKIDTYHGQPTMDGLLTFVGGDPTITAEVIEFVQEIHPIRIEQGVPPAASLPAILDNTPLNLMDELSYNYRIAKMVLQTSLTGERTTDAEETRKSLTTISKFMEQALKLQERLYNAQQIQKFQDAVLDELSSIDPVIRDNVLQRLLEAGI